MLKNTLDNILKPSEDKRPLYLRVKLDPLNAYRAFAFILFFLIAMFTSGYASIYQIIVNATGAIVVVYLLTTVSLWTKSKATLYSATQYTLVLLNVVMVLSALTIIFTGNKNAY